jgi:hypothetical protein
MARQFLVDQCLHSIEVSWVHTTLLGLLWMSEQPGAETSTWQHTALTKTDILSSGGIRNRNPSKRAAAEPRLRPRGHWNLFKLFLTVIVTFRDQNAWCLPFLHSEHGCDKTWCLCGMKVKTRSTRLSYPFGATFGRLITNSGHSYVIYFVLKMSSVKEYLTQIVWLV